MTRKHTLRIATLNLQGGNKKKSDVAEDMEKYRLDVMCTTD